MELTANEYVRNVIVIIIHQLTQQFTVLSFFFFSPSIARFERQ